MPWSCSARRSLSSAQTPALFHEINAKNSQSAQGTLPPLCSALHCSALLALLCSALLFVALLSSFLFSILPLRPFTLHAPLSRPLLRAESPPGIPRAASPRPSSKPRKQRRGFWRHLLLLLLLLLLLHAVQHASKGPGVQDAVGECRASLEFRRGREV
eukprot:758330-Hanusia_phi.AAC.1